MNTDLITVESLRRRRPLVDRLHPQAAIQAMHEEADIIFGQVKRVVALMAALLLLTAVCAHNDDIPSATGLIFRALTIVSAGLAMAPALTLHHLLRRSDAIKARLAACQADILKQLEGHHG